MFGFLSRYLFYQFFLVFTGLCLIFFPFLFSVDIFIHGVYSPLESLLKVPFRYGQLLGMLCFLFSYIFVKRIFYVHGRWIFISLKYKKSYLLFPIFYLSFLISFIFYSFILPLNDHVFEAKSHVSDWAILRKKDSLQFIYNDKSIYDVWQIDKDLKIQNYQKPGKSMDLGENAFYIVWSETKKMSFARLEEYKEYYDANGFVANDYYKQKHIYYSRFLVIISMMLCGCCAAIENSLVFFVLCFLFFNWIDLLAFFLPVKYCILIVWVNVSIWFIIGFFSFFV